MAELKQQKTTNEIIKGTCHDDITVLLIFLDHDLLESSQIKEILSSIAFNTSVFMNAIRGEHKVGSSLIFQQLLVLAVPIPMRVQRKWFKIIIL